MVIDYANAAQVTEHHIRTPDSQKMSLQGVPLPISPANQQVLHYLESTFNQIIQDIQANPCKKAAIVLRRITSISPYHDQEDSMRLKWHIKDTEVVYTFPGKNKDAAWRFGRSRAWAL